MRDKTLYFADGSFVLSALGDKDDIDQANDTDEGLVSEDKHGDIIVYFRVHQSLLSRTSTVFADMFTVGSASSTDDLYDGVPLIAVQDKAEYLRGFLKAIYEPSFATSSIFLPRYSSATARLFKGPLRLAIMYQADALKARLISHLQTDWPGKDYDRWTRRQAEFPDATPPDPQELLNLVRTTNLADELRTPLAVAYYAMLGYPAKAWVPRMLEVTDLIILAIGRCKINAWLCAWTKGDTGKAEIPAGPKLELTCKKCTPERFREKLLLDWMSESSEANSQVIEYLQRIANSLSKGHGGGCCSRCRSEVQQWLREMAEAFYDHLEEIFQEPGT
ncbi:hypothetical protein EYR40_010484 [Pleurotus pulmonarius]|nr:hypothetical protein EYR36_010130 [Pleurotus pulmonarius]KAF4588929.1 hypothetical protein EYR40_010484 [Pleurotus pulmonarius]